MKKYSFLVFAVFLFSCSDKTGKFDNVPADVTVQSGNNQFTILSGMIALEEIEVKKNANINSNLYVIGGCTLKEEEHEEEHDDEQPELHCSKIEIHENVNVGAKYTLKAEIIEVKKDAIIDGALEASTFDISPSATIKQATKSLGDLPGYPAFLIGTIGSVNVADSVTPLAEGNYRKLKIGEGKTLTLSEGWYSFESIELKKDATLNCLKTCVVMVKGSIKSEKRTKIITATGNPNDLTFFVSAEHKIESDDENEKHEDHSEHDDDDIEIKIGKESLVVANIYAKTAELKFGKDSNVLGSFIARKIEVEKNTTVSTGYILTKDTIYSGTVNDEQVLVDMKKNGYYEMITSAEPRVKIQGHYFLTPDNEIIHFESENALCTTCGNLTLPDSVFTNIPFKDLELNSISESEISVSPITDSILPAPAYTFTKTNTFAIDTTTGYTTMNITVNYPDASYNGKMGILQIGSDEVAKAAVSIIGIVNTQAIFTFKVKHNVLPVTGDATYNGRLYVANRLADLKIDIKTKIMPDGLAEIGDTIFPMAIKRTETTMTGSINFSVLEVP